MADGSVRIEGGARLRRTLRAAGDDLSDLKAAHTAAAATAASGARGLVPTRTGRLAGSIRSSGTNSAGIVRAGRASIPYAGPIHWGWPARRIAAQPFLSDGATNTEPAWLPVYTAALDAALSKVEGI